mmetsp:Transcript_33845/g.39378  ORF Transcript_33845/g.39378 Transcript_33845/m.39378 type:complete len:91 (+) Transcript_33845:38-310(+)
MSEPKDSAGGVSALATSKLNRLVDLEWRFSMVTSTSEIPTASNCSVQLKLTLQDPLTLKNEIRYLDLTIQQFYELHNDITKIKGLIDFVG